ncbi:Uncharacterized protein conserved in archaea [Archaeoglobus sulfaticallidus PM70-1]|uniref:Multifunctional fusion protein n=1 Tax=Archaeoglobus sulfaticallidus PM70-1 TaxID=387631 RepID=N0BLK3_9EURY|nr:AAA family ATPase [Archaeoglobus sulfaticallidus]AGK61085.1 Uncharacterized protein conserved in archaea [Archaeoglobus sulfaticallidus PM70-1]
MKLIAFIGYPLSGKSTAGKIAESLGIPVVIMGDIVREEVRKRGLELNDENAGKIANELREKEGMDAIARRCIPRIREKGKKGIVVVDGIRGVAEVERFKKEFGDDFILIAIESDIKNRFDRALRRKRDDDVKSIDELKERDRREESWGMKEAFDMADLTIENNSDFETFRSKVEAVLKSILKSIDVIIETRVYPTEDEEKVVKAIKNFFPDAEISIEDDVLRARAKNINHFRELLRMQKILDTARNEMLKSVSGNEITILLNKQTATVSRINFVEEDAILSPIKITFRLYGIQPERLIDYLAPETRDGRPVKELKESELFE